MALKPQSSVTVTLILMTDDHIPSLRYKFTFVGAGHRLDWNFVVVVLAHGKRKDAHLSARGDTRKVRGSRSGERGEKRGVRPLASVWCYRLVEVGILEDLLGLLLPSVGEQHDDLVAVGP